MSPPKPEFSTLRFAHSEGRVVLCGRANHCEEGTQKSTDLDEDVPDDLHVGDAATALCSNGDTFYAGITTANKHLLQAFQVKDGKPGNVVAKSNLSVTCAAISAKLDAVAVGFSDFNIKWVTLGDSTNYRRLSGHDAPVLHVAIHPDAKYLASSSCDGTVRIWPLSGDSLTALHTFPVLTKSNEPKASTSRHELEWVGNDLLVATSGRVIVYSADNQFAKPTRTLVHPKFKDAVVYSTLAVCASGKYVASTTLCGRVCVWQVADGRLVCFAARDSSDPTVCAIMWHPAFDNVDDMQLVLADYEGQICSLRDIFCGQTGGTAAQPISFGGASPIREQSDDVLDDDEDNEDDDNSNSKPPGAFADDQAAEAFFDDDDEESRSSSIGAIKRKYGFGDDQQNGIGGDELMDDDDDVILDRPTKVHTKRFCATPSQSLQQSSTRSGWQPPRLPMVLIPGSTPEHLTTRYMKWNSSGLMRQYNLEGENTIEIEYHDSSVHAPISIDNNEIGYSAGDLTDEAYVLLARSDGEKKQSCVFVQHFGGWAGGREWMVELPPGEDAECCAIGVGWLAVSTTKSYIRLFTISGSQLYVITANGPIITLCAFNDQLAVITNAATLFDGTTMAHQRYELSLHTVPLTPEQQTRIPCTCAVPVSPRSSIEWIGFSSHGSLCTYDTNGVVRMLYRHLQHSWMPIAELDNELKNKHDHVWVYAVNENPSQIRCVFVRGNKYPPLLPKPVPMTLPWTVPLCESSSEKSRHEATLMCARLQERNLSDAFDQNVAVIKEHRLSQLDSIMRLFALATSNSVERMGRALELANMLNSASEVQHLITYAKRMRMEHLAEKLAEVARQKMALEQQKADGEFVDRDVQMLAEMNASLSTSAPVRRQRSGSDVEEISAPTGNVMKPTRTSVKRRRRDIENASKRNAPSPLGTQASTGSSLPDWLSEQSQALDSQQTQSLLDDDEMSVRTTTIIDTDVDHSDSRRLNPFKKSVPSSATSGSSSSASVFEMMAAKPAPRIDTADKAPVKSTRKQATLNFGSDKKTSNVTGYQLWRAVEKHVWMVGFDGDASDENALERYAIQQFRLLDKQAKADWNARAKQPDAAQQLEAKSVLTEAN